MAAPAAAAETAKEVAERTRDERNAMLVVTGLFFAVTYTAVLQPPGGTNDKGKSNLRPNDFLIFAICNTVGYTASVVYIIELVETVPWNSLFHFCIFGISGTYSAALFAISPAFARRWIWFIPFGMWVALSCIGLSTKFIRKLCT